MEDLYEKYVLFNNEMLESHRPLEIAAIMIAQGLSIYKTMLSEEEYQKMVDSISDAREQVKIIQGPVIQ
jgi:hypothetical protein